MIFIKNQSNLQAAIKLFGRALMSNKSILTLAPMLRRADIQKIGV